MTEVRDGFDWLKMAVQDYCHLQELHVCASVVHLVLPIRLRYQASQCEPVEDQSSWCGYYHYHLEGDRLCHQYDRVYYPLRDL